MTNAVYYRDMYLLLPEEYPDFDAFRQFLRRSELPVDIDMVVLRENHKIPCWTVFKGESIAPYFLTGYHDLPSRVSFQDAEKIYPVQVELMDQDAYNARLRAVINEFCPGCRRFKPLTNRVQSLNGHHGEIALNAVCFYRYEENPSPRVFHDLLFSFGGFFIRSNFSSLDEKGIRERLAWNYLRYKSGVLQETEGEKYLTLECKKGELLSPILTKFVGRYVEAVADKHYHIRLKDDFSCSEALLDSILSDDNRGAFQKECKKYGVSIGILEYDPHAAEDVCGSLQNLANHYYLEPLLTAPGRHYYLITDTSHVLKELHYRTPLLEANHTFLTLYSQKESRKYKICFDMSSTVL